MPTLTPEQAKAERVVNKIIKDLSDRRGLRQEWEGIDDDIQTEIRQEWVAITMKELLKP